MHKSHAWLFACLLLSLSGITNAQETTPSTGSFADPQWRFSTNKPKKNWFSAEFDDAKWARGLGGFGTKNTPGARVSTIWRTPDIWIRRQIELASVPKNPAVMIYHDEDAEVFINGKKVLDVAGFTTEFKVIPLDEAGRTALQVGNNLVAVHCHQTAGGQGIDVHIIDGDNIPSLPPAARERSPFKSDLITTWGESVTAENVWQEYPRPQMTRGNWKNLNGHWDYAITPRTQAEKPDQWTGKILVPFALESKLSGVQRLLSEDESLWYHLALDTEPTSDRRTRLNFEAVDYRCDVFVNDVKVGSHQGGNVPFGFDVTDAIRKGKNEIVVRVDDDTEKFQLNGKQSLNPRGIWYTQVSGIWQTVWMEEVPTQSIEDLKISTDAAKGTITVKSAKPLDHSKKTQLRVIVRDGEKIVSQAKGPVSALTIEVQNAKRWSPAKPHLYELNVAILAADGSVIDEVGSYAGIRSVGKARDENGHLRFTLNGETVFHWGPLDQGWWPDGLLTPPSDEAMAFDIDFLKKSGFNMIRKHIKVEPRRYYYHCDKMGMMVWQDQVSGGAKPEWTRLKENPVDAVWSDQDHEQFMAEFEAMVTALENHPSIVVWTPFNEAWGQHRTVEVGHWISKRDPSRLVNLASGGNFWPAGDIVDEHAYPHPKFPFDAKRDEHFIKVVGEFGGHGLPSEGHLWDTAANNWGYGGLPKDKGEYQDRYRESICILEDLKAQGIAAGVYTQTTDVEGEINGLLSYDRKVIKISPAELSKIHAPLLK